MTAPRVQVSLRELPNNQIGPLLVARVRNAGLVPVKITRVVLQYDQTTATDSNGEPQGEQEPTREIVFGPMEHRSGFLKPGKAREWYLAMEPWKEAIQVGRDLPPEHYSILASAGDEVVECLEGMSVLPFLDRAPKPGEVWWSRRAEWLLDGLEAAEKQRVLGVIDTVKGAPAIWGSEDAIRLSGKDPVYLIRVSPQRRAFIRRFENGG